MVIGLKCPECDSTNTARMKDLEYEMYHKDHLIWDVKVWKCKHCDWFNVLFTTHRKIL
jgi:hypothetical protein